MQVGRTAHQHCSPLRPRVLLLPARRWGPLPRGSRGPGAVPGTVAAGAAASLGDLRGQVQGVVELPLHIAWSGMASYDLSKPRRLSGLYRAVLHEDLSRHLDQNLLLRMHVAGACGAGACRVHAARAGRWCDLQQVIICRGPMPDHHLCCLHPGHRGVDLGELLAQPFGAIASITLRCITQPRTSATTSPFPPGSPSEPTRHSPPGIAIPPVVEVTQRRGAAGTGRTAPCPLGPARGHVQKRPWFGHVWPVPPQVLQVLPRCPLQSGQLTTGTWSLRHFAPLPDRPALNSPPPVVTAQSLPCRGHRCPEVQRLHPLEQHRSSC